MTQNTTDTVVPGSGQFDKEKSYWLDKFNGELVKSHFLYDFKAREETGYAPDTVDFALSHELFTQVERLTRNSNSNLFAVLVATLNLMLSKYTGNDDIVIGTPILKQEVEGSYLNTLLALRNQLDTTMNFKQLLMQAKKTFNEANDNSNYPIQRLLYYLGLPKIENGSPLFETVILLENIHDKKYIAHLNHNLIFSFSRSDEGITGSIEYNTALYRKETILQIIAHFEILLKHCLNHLDLPVSQSQILSEEESQTLFHTFNHSQVASEHFKPLHRWFEEQVEKTPQHKAVVVQNDYFFSETALTYQQLNSKANQLARLLIEKGVGPDTIVGIITMPSLEMAVGVLAIAKAGGAYLPIDPESPEDRKDFLLQESGASLLLTQSFLNQSENFSGETVFIDQQEIYNLDDANLEVSSDLDDLFYVIYTSGTTGRPKGGLLTHRNLVNYVNWFSKTAQLTPEDKTVLTSSFAFDLGYTTFLGSLLTGGQLHLVTKDTYIDSESLLEYIRDNHITFLKMTPSLFSVISNNPEFSKENCAALRLVLLGGEAINTIELEKAHQRCSHLQIMNHYGPTETTIGSVARLIDFHQLEAYKQEPTIGKPIFNTKVYILDKYMQPVPMSVPGELLIGGEGVARGYLNRPELTSDKFVSLPFPGAPARLYRTGDLTRWMPDGNIQFLGRIDNQVKIRGFRVELGEIENQLLNHSGVDDAVVMAIDEKSGGKNLCAYVVTTPGDYPVDIVDLKEYLAVNLPDYMIPTYFLFLEKIPLTPNGKIDRKALLKIEILSQSNDYTPPENESQAKMIDIWAEVLNVEADKIGIHTNFFELGGHSLKVMLLISKIHKEFNVKISLVEVFNSSTPAKLAQLIGEKDDEDVFMEIEPAEIKAYYPLSSAQQRFYLGQQLTKDSKSYNMPATLILPLDFDIDSLESIFNRLIQRHESLRTSFSLVENTPVQIIHPDVQFSIQHYKAKADEVNNVIAEFIQPFDIHTPPLFRVGLIATEEEYILIVDINHIISDGVSLQILTREFKILSEGGELPPLRIQYKDYATWQYNSLSVKQYKEMEDFWLQSLKNFKITKLNNDHLSHSLPATGKSESAVIEKESYQSIEEFCARHRLTNFAFMLATFMFILEKETGENDLTLGTPIENRDHSDLENIMGVFLNVFLLRAIIDKEKTALHNILTINDTLVKALNNSTYPYEELYYKIKDSNKLADEDLFTILFNFLPREVEVNAKTLSIDPVQMTPKYPVTLYISDVNKKMIINVLYRGDMYSNTRIQRIVHNYRKFIEDILKNEHLVLTDLVYEDLNVDDNLKELEGEFDNDDLF